ncbi:telomerase inhibitor [Elasticomyces elasticus]|nr:telomerase inhibitor [Elasticomyces elasticus]KAK3660996.1 telomerase inhibitor [Elasticomyces elasticus]KAK4932403.1 telomerase inhibitor [Elasticomyces elasticus]KAK5768411.1 telomerase inhibitor [Elasticomyces elasticus]
MGLGAPKNRVKLSRDPNNTAWSNSTEGYGHRILSSQGWKTGDYLGAENAAHADTYTAANASHVRVALREDGLGLGAKVGGKSNAETFGLSTLSSIFGRLNGKSDEDLEKQQKNLRDAELRTYQAQKHGFMNFVRGGLLVGDKIEEFPVVKKVEPSIVVVAKNDTDVKTSKKRKADGDDHETEDGDQQKEKKRKSFVGDEDDTAATPNAARTQGKLKKRKERQSEAVDTTTEVTETAGDVEKAAKRQRKEQRRLERASRGEETSRDEKSRLKQEKRARKEDRRKRKEEKRRAKAASDDSSDSEPTTTTTTVVTTAIPTPATSEAASGASTPVQAAPMFSGGRHAIRQRYIMQKRMASMDPRALNEILMIKAQV